MCMIYSGITKLYIIVSFLAVVHLSFSGNDQQKTKVLETILKSTQRELSQKLKMVSHTKKFLPQQETFHVAFTEDGYSTHIICHKKTVKENDFFDRDSFEIYEIDNQNASSLDPDQTKRLYTLIETTLQTTDQENSKIVGEFELVK